jgi:GH24 family phage-related lysozyme (muramidase)
MKFAALTGLVDGFSGGLELKQAADDREAEKKARAAGIAGMTGAPPVAVAPGTENPHFSDTTSLIRGFEGYRDTPYWDVNAYRVGYGSDTVTMADGTVQRVSQGMKIGREDADRDLARRTAEFQNTAAKQAGESWAKLAPAAQGALTSIAYNYGSLPSRILPAVRSGDPVAIADAIEGLGSDNDGINAKRRAKEAALVRSAAAQPQTWGALRKFV